MANGSNLVHGSWEEAEAMVGRPLLRLEGADEVARADFRRSLEVIGVDCPLHTDEATAREHGYATVVSPVSMTRAYAMPPYRRPGEHRLGSEPRIPAIAGASVPGVGDTLIATGVRMAYGEAIHPGDRISATAVLRSVRRVTTRIGPGAFIVVETTYVNQRGDTVAVETATLFRYQRRGAPA